MRIIELNSLNNGSTGNIMLRIAKAAKDSGDDVLTCFPRRRQNVKKICSDSKMFGNSISTQSHYFFAKWFGFDGRFSWLSTLSLINIIKRFKPDLIHIHNLHGCFVNLKLFFTFLKKHEHIKVVWTFHDCWPFTGGCAHFQIAKCDKWKNSQCYKCNKIVEYPKGKHDNTFNVYNLKMNLFASLKHLTIVTPSMWLSKVVSNSFFNKYIIMTINNGIDLNRFIEKKNNFRKINNITNDTFVLLGVAFNWSYRKGLDIFVKLANCLGKDFQIIMIGTNDDVDKILPSNIISIHKTFSIDEMVNIYSSADLFVNPTREDNFPTVNIESLACGTPVLTFDTGGSSEILNNQVGSVVAKDDFSGLYREIIRIKEERPYSKKACRERSLLYDENEKTKEYIRLFHSL